MRMRLTVTIDSIRIRSMVMMMMRRTNGIRQRSFVAALPACLKTYIESSTI